MIKIKAKRTNCITHIETEVDITLDKHWHSRLNSWWMEIVEGGVTGYESISFKALKEHIEDNRGWLACAGTKGRWDTLLISAEELKKLEVYLCRADEKTKGKTNVVA